ncbi:hypothetical protein H4Q26_004466 [Puccinia striiformis f. sp. tritici PST-130]|nr:hypothetical protein H4Q26_004466 [Puccinia striiformis f. sp. tritici PST-130]
MPESSTNPPPADYGATAAPVPAATPSTSKPPTASRIEPKARSESHLSIHHHPWCTCYGGRLCCYRNRHHWIWTLSLQERIRLIKERYSGHFDDVIAPLIISGSLFLAILVNFILRAIDNERHKNSDDIPKAPWIAAPASNRFPPSEVFIGRCSSNDFPGTPKLTPAVKFNLIRNLQPSEFFPDFPVMRILSPLLMFWFWLVGILRSKCVGFVLFPFPSSSIYCNDRFVHFVSGLHMLFTYTLLRRMPETVNLPECVIRSLQLPPSRYQTFGH